MGGGESSAQGGVGGVGGDVGVGMGGEGCVYGVFWVHLVLEFGECFCNWS